MRRVACIAGARPNFVKMGPVLRGLEKAGVPTTLIHTGQHYDAAMSDLFFEQLNLPKPDVHLEVGSGSHGAQTARILERYESWLLEQETKPAATLVVGDVNSTVACALASTKLHVPVIHVEAGLRSLDRAMPEEINRVLTDAISELLLVSEPSGLEHLRHEGRPEDAIRLVGNVMIDVLKAQLPKARELRVLADAGVEAGGYVLCTLHRPSNVDEPAQLERLARALLAIARQLPVVFPVHPRTRGRLDSAGLLEELESATGVRLLEPQGYLEFLSLSSQARVIVTDSGGLQEESTVLGIPCLTMRENTERPITVSEGTSTLVGTDTEKLVALVDEVLAGRYKQGRAPELWDGCAGERVGVEVAAFLERAC